MQHGYCLKTEPDSSKFSFDLLESRRLFSGPAVIDAQFQFLNAPSRVTVQFDANVSASLSTADLQLQNHTTFLRISNASISLLSYDTQTNTATFTFPGAVAGVLPDGNYRLRVLKAGVTDSMNIPMAQDGVLDFFVFSGDANRDRTINIGDFGALASNFNAANNFAGGDFNYSGVTDISDFAILASKFNQGLPALSAPTTRYTVTVLPASPWIFGRAVLPMAMNDSGQVVGREFRFDGGPMTGDSNGFSWRPGETSLTGSQLETAADVSNSGTIVGWSINDENALWTTQGNLAQRFIDLPGSPGGQEYAYSINNLGQTVGSDDKPFVPNPPQPLGIRWPSTAHAAQPIGSKMLMGINDAGDMIGDGPRVFPAGGGPSTLIGTTDGLPMSINEYREVVGVIGTYAPVPQNQPWLFDTSGSAFYWKPGMTEPFILESFGQSDAKPRAISDAGVIVGSGAGGLTPNGALIWKDGMPYELRDLTDPIPGQDYRLQGAVDINASGQILAYGQLLPDPIISVVRRAFLLTPIPSTEPLVEARGGEELSGVTNLRSTALNYERTLLAATFGAVRIDILNLGDRLA